MEEIGLRMKPSLEIQDLQIGRHTDEDLARPKDKSMSVTKMGLLLWTEETI